MTFYADKGDGDFFGWKENDFVYEFFADSTFAITPYQFGYLYYTGSIFKSVITGTYKKHDNSLQLLFLHNNYQPRYSQLKGISDTTRRTFVSGLPNYTNTWFVIKDSIIIDTKNIFPTLEYVTNDIAAKLERRFNNWGIR